MKIEHDDALQELDDNAMHKRNYFFTKDMQTPYNFATLTGSEQALSFSIKMEVELETYTFCF